MNDRLQEADMEPGKTLVLRRDMSKCVLPKDKGAVRTAIFVAFLSGGHGGAGAPPDPALFVSNDELLRDLRRSCEGVEFIARDFADPSSNPESFARELEERKTEIDGVLLVGFGTSLRDDRWIFSGVPTIIVYNLFEFMHVPYKILVSGREDESILVGRSRHQRGRILTGELDRSGVCRGPIAAAMFSDLLYKIKLIQTIRKLNQSRILVIAPQKVLAEVDYRGDVHAHMPQDYNQAYTRTVKDSLGVELVIRPPEDFYEAYEQTDEKAAKRISVRWTQHARDVQAAESEITKTARAYLAFDLLRKRYDCNAVSTQMSKVKPGSETEDMFWPGLALECGFKMAGIQATCQNYPNLVVAQLLAYFLTGRPSMLGDLIIDLANSVTILTHCGAPINPYGDDTIVPYSIATHAQSPVRGTRKPGSGTGLHVEWPAGEPVTIWKVYVLHHKIGLYTGQVVDARSLYTDRVDDILCRTKLVARVEDPQKIQNHYSPAEYGIHRAATLGDLRQLLKDVGALLGYTVVEEDR